MKFRKWLFSFALVCLVVALFGAPDALAATTDDGWNYEITDSNLTITGYTGTETELTIPAEIEGYPVTGIGDSAFGHCTSLTSVTIPDSVTRIRWGAFYSCSGLTSVTIGSGVTSIEDRAFYGCSSLTSITIPDSVTEIGTYAFFGCTSMTSVTIGNGVTSIEDRTFCGCSSLTSVTIPNSVTSIGEYAFYGCDSLTSVTIGNGVTSIGGYAFCSCDSLTSITIPDSVTSIGEYAFAFTSLTSVTIPDSVTSIEDRTFCGCSSLTSVTIGSGVTKIGQYAFYGCWNIEKVYTPSLAAWCGIDFENWCSTPVYYADFYIGETLVTDLVIPDGVTEIKPYAFQGCTSLRSVTVPDSVTSIGEDAFEGCWHIENVYTPSLAAWCGIDFGGSYSSPACNGADLYINNTLVTELVLPDSMTSIGNYTFAGCWYLTSVTIPDSVTEIGDEAFYGCDSLTGITIPANVASIGDKAFASCPSLTSIVVAEGNPVYHSSGNCLIETASKTLIAGCSTSMIPDDGSVTSIGDYAFYNCWILTSISIPDSVTGIGSCAFEGCTSLPNVTIGRGVTSIGYRAFSYCWDLTSIAIPDSVTEIEEGAFYDCDSLSTVYYNGTADDWAEITINNEYDANDSLLNAERHYVAFIDLIDEAGAAKLAFCEWGQTLSMDEIEALYAHHVTLYTDAAHTEAFDLTTAVNENLTLYVELGDPFYYSVTVAVTGNGTVEVSTTRAAAGETVSFTVTANGDFGVGLRVLTESGKQLELTWTDDDNVLSFTFTMPAENVEIHAEFVKYYSVTVADTENGTVEVSTHSAKAGETVSFAVAAYDGYVLDEVVVVNESGEPLDLAELDLTDPDSPWMDDYSFFSFIMPAEDVEIHAVFVSDDDDSGIGGGDDSGIGGGDDSGIGGGDDSDIGGGDDSGIGGGDDSGIGGGDSGIGGGDSGIGGGDSGIGGGDDADCPSRAFTDLASALDENPTAWWLDATNYVIENGLMKGVGENRFQPNGTTTRAMLVTILYRLAGSPAVNGTSEFSDVPSDLWYTDAVIWAAENGIVNGRGDGTFGPDDVATREQIAVIFYRFAQYQNMDVSATTDLDTYPDCGDISVWALDAMKWANASGLMIGRADDQGNTALAPAGEITRSEMAMLLYRWCTEFAK